MDNARTRLLAGKMQLQAQMVRVESVQAKARTFAEYLPANTRKQKKTHVFIFGKKRG